MVLGAGQDACTECEAGPTLGGYGAAECVPCGTNMVAWTPSEWLACTGDCEPGCAMCTAGRNCENGISEYCPVGTWKSQDGSEFYCKDIPAGQYGFTHFLTFFAPGDFFSRSMLYELTVTNG
jgi:hypothetical protein